MTRPLRILLLTGATALCLGAAVGCGGSSSGAQPSSRSADQSSRGDGGPSSYIDNEKVERSIERSVRHQRHRQVFVSCPSLVKIRKGATFTCVAPTRRGDAMFRVTMKDAKGHVHYEAGPR